MKTVTNLDSSVYYQGKYWNDIPQIARYVSKNLTGNEDKYWIADFKDRFATKPFQNALFLNCGDGRWEREFIDREIVKRATAFDVSPDFIKKAIKDRGKRKIKYFIADVNKVKLKKDSFDLVVNIAAFHHTQYINRICKMLAISLKEEGLLVSHDYIGPRRNQYPLVNWLLIKLVNNTLPKSIKKPNLGYPHLPTMLATDPTEAINSNLINSSIKRYFEILEQHDYGGGIAYEIFTHNSKLTEKVLSSPKTNITINKVLALDKLFSKTRMIPSYFSLLIAKPNKDTLSSSTKNRYFQNDENLREKYSSKLNNTYTTLDFLRIIKGHKSIKGRLRLIIKYIIITPSRIKDKVGIISI